MHEANKTIENNRAMLGLVIDAIKAEIALDVYGEILAWIETQEREYTTD
jgi:hypothetical protein